MSKTQVKESPEVRLNEDQKYYYDKILEGDESYCLHVGLTASGRKEVFECAIKTLLDSENPDETKLGFLIVCKKLAERSLELAARINKFKDNIHKIYKNMDEKTRCMIDVLGEISNLEGLSVDVDWGGDLLYGLCGSSEQTEQILKKHVDDPAMKMLSEVLAYAQEIIKIENKEVDQAYIDEILKKTSVEDVKGN